MRFSTTDLTSLAPGSLNGGKSHALFYIFHIVPEFAVATMILSLNVRKIFDTGLWGGLIGKRANIQRQSSARA